MTITHPNGGRQQHFLAGETVTITWDTAGLPADIGTDFTLLLAEPDPLAPEGLGAILAPIAVSLHGAQRHYAWTIPTAVPAHPEAVIYIRAAAPGIPKGFVSDTSDAPMSVHRFTWSIRSPVGVVAGGL